MMQGNFENLFNPLNRTYRFYRWNYAIYANLHDARDALEQLNSNWIAVSTQCINYNYVYATVVLANKQLVCKLMLASVYQLKHGFAPFVDKVFHPTVSLLQYYLDDDIRKLAVQTIGCLFDAAQTNGMYYTM